MLALALWIGGCSSMLESDEVDFAPRGAQRSPVRPRPVSSSGGGAIGVGDDAPTPPSGTKPPSGKPEAGGPAMDGGPPVPPESSLPPDAGSAETGAMREDAAIITDAGTIPDAAVISEDSGTTTGRKRPDLGPPPPLSTHEGIDPALAVTITASD